MKQNKVYAFGKHALKEALTHAPKAVLKVYLDAKMADTKLQRQLQQAGIPVAKLSEGMARSDMRAGTAHQGIIGAISLHELMLPYPKFAEALEATPAMALVLLNGVQDPHNVGAIIRSAAAFGMRAILMPDAGQAPITGAVIKVSAGMAFRVPLVKVDTVKQAVADLKARGFKVYALAGDPSTPFKAGGATPIGQEKFESPSVFILGNEGSGIPDDLRRLCDGVLAIPMHPRAESLNVAASAAVALYAWSAQHPAALA